MSRRGKIAVVCATALGAAGCGLLIVVVVGDGLVEAGLWAGVLGAIATICGAVLAVLPLATGRSRALAPARLQVPGWVVDRPAEVSAVAAALTGRETVTAVLHGAGGFGKTTLAIMACADRRVRRRFGQQVYRVTVGRDVKGAAKIAAKVNDVIRLVGGEDSAFTDPELAGRRLGALLDKGPRRLLVIDDVWNSEQLAPFAEGGRQCARLITTRVPGLAPGPVVRVDQMSSRQSRAVLLADGLERLSTELVEELLTVTGRWPLLLSLVNKILENAAQTGADVNASAVLLLQRLRADGPAIVDDLSGRTTSAAPDMDQPQKRAQAVRATIQASTSLLDPQDVQRFEELAVFAEDEVIPFPLVAGLWRMTAGLDDLEAAQLSARLAGLALVSLGESGAEGLELHDVIRDFLRAGMDPARLARLNSQAVEAAAADLPRVESLNPGDAMQARVAWWELGTGSRYLHDHLITHLINAGRTAEAEAVAADLRWVSARLQAAGPAGPVADLAQVDTPLAARLLAVLEGATHLLAPTRPKGAVIDVLFARVTGDPYWARQATILQKHRSGPRLISRWPLPDLPDPSLRRVIPNRTKVAQVAIAADGRWLAIGGEKIQIVDVLTGRQRAAFTIPRDRVLAMRVTADGRQLVVYTVNSELRVWDTVTWQERPAFAKPHARAIAAAIAPDGTWIATAAEIERRGGDGTVRLWDAFGRSGQIIDRPFRIAGSLAIAPDGTWLAAGGYESITRIWDVRTGQERAALVQRETVTVVAISPDGSWVATGDSDGVICFWDAATWQEKILPGTARTLNHTRKVNAAAVAPDGTWLATGHANGEISLWDAATQRERVRLRGHTGAVTAVVIAPDGTWLASGGEDGTMRIWDPAVTQDEIAAADRNIPINGMVTAPAGNWLATGTSGRIRIWDAATGKELATVTGASGTGDPLAVAPDGTWIATSHLGTTGISAVNGQERIALGNQGNWAKAAASPDGTWLATSGSDGTVMIWDTATWRRLIVLRSQAAPLRALAIAPDGSWLAVGGEGGRVQIWDTATWDERASLRFGRASLSDMGIAPDGSWLAAGDRNGRVRIWDVATWQKRATLKSKSSWIEFIAIAPDSTWMAVGGYGGRVGIWDAATWRGRGSLLSDAPVALSPGGTWLAAADKKGTLWVWNTATWQAATMMRVDGAIGTLAWLDDELLVAGGSSGLYQFALALLHLNLLGNRANRDHKAMTLASIQPMHSGDRFCGAGPAGLAVPVFGQVQGDLAVAGDPGGDADEVAAQRGASGFGAAAPMQER